MRRLTALILCLFPGTVSGNAQNKTDKKLTSELQGLVKGFNFVFNRKNLPACFLY